MGRRVKRTALAQDAAPFFFCFSILIYRSAGIEGMTGFRTISYAKIYLFGKGNLLAWGVIMKQRLAVWGLLLAFMMITLLAFAIPAQAHADLVSSHPKAGEHLEQPPSKVDLYFSETVEPTVSEILVYDSEGNRIDSQKTIIDPNDPTHLTVSLLPVQDGYFTVFWRAVSTDDGHLTGDTFTFSVGEVAGAAPTIGSAGKAPAAFPAQALVKGLLYLSVALLAGGIIFLLYVWRRIGNLPGFEKLFERVMAAGLVLASLTTLLGVWLEAAAVQAGLPGSAGAAFGGAASQFLDVLTSTRFGVLALSRLVVLFVLAGLLIPPQNRWNRLAALPFTLLLLLTISLVSHAAAQENPLLTISLDTLHLAAASIWTGGVLFFLLAVIWSRRFGSAARTQLTAQLLSRFSSLAFASVGILGLTGIYEAVMDVGSLQGLVGTDYGRALMIKLALAFGMIILGGINHFIQKPRIEQSAQSSTGIISGKPGGLISTGSRLGGFRRSLTLEATLGVILLLWVGLFTSLPPASPSASAGQIVRIAQTGDLRLKLVITPGKVGIENRYTLQIDSATGPVSDAKAVDLYFFSSDNHLPPSNLKLSNSGEGKYSGQGPYPAFPDLWQIRLLLLRPGNLQDFADFYVDLQPGFTLPLKTISQILFACAVVGLIFAVWMILRKKGMSVQADQKALRR
jgi:copper transport protein